MKKLDKKSYTALGMALAGAILASIASAQDSTMQAPVAQPVVGSDAENTGTGSDAPPVALPVLPPVVEVKAVDVDTHTVSLNKPGIVTLVLCTGEDSQDSARKAGDAMFPFQGMAEFQLIVVVDLRDSLATWVPSVAVGQMRSNLDKEAIELKPYFLKNGNTSNPRDSSHVIADFTGATCVQVGWTQTSENLRAILYGVDGREIKRWDKVDNMDKLQADVRIAVSGLIVAEKRAHAGSTKKKQGSKTTDQSTAPRDESASPGDQPLPPVAPPASQDKFPPPGSRPPGTPSD